LIEEALRQGSLPRRIAQVPDGVAALERLHDPDAPRPDLILLDLNMPRMNGFECLQEIRKSERLKPIPVVIFSTTSQTQAIDKVYEQGADYYIRKPNTFAMLKEVIERMLEIDWAAHHEQPAKENFLLNKNG
ncbi:MAG TPA: response regulator, partial [Cyclobacteriaceae bacterium]|nr:response regulator [Cyclobacteriaceae bacterium]